MNVTVKSWHDLLTFEGESQMGQVPDLAVVVVKDFVLTVVLNHVLSDELVIDDCWTHRLLVPFNFLLGLESTLNVWLHWRMLVERYHLLLFSYGGGYLNLITT